MQEYKKLASVFEAQPDRWGLRGDPHLWREMRDSLSDQAYPPTEEEFTVLLEQTYKRLVGAPLGNREAIFVDRYSHGGMSSGYVSPQFWAETAIPLLQIRYREIK